MATALDIITGALRKIRVLAIGREPKAAETEHGLTALNEMLSTWRINGIDLAPTALLSTDTLDVPDDHLETIRLSLAERIAGDYGAQVSPIDSGIAADGRAALRAYHFTIKTIGIDHIAAIPRWQTD